MAAVVLLLSMLPVHTVMAVHTASVTNTPSFAADNTSTSFILNVAHTGPPSQKAISRVDLTVDASWTVPGSQPAAPTDWSVSVAGNVITWTANTVPARISSGANQNFNWQATSGSWENSSHSWVTTDSVNDTNSGSVGTTVSDWQSYSDSGHTTQSDYFDISTPHVYMMGNNFPAGDIKVGYYDVPGNLAETDTYLGFAGGVLLSECITNQDWGGSKPVGDGTWHAVVLKTSGSMPSTYAAAIADPNYLTDDDFYVTDAAIPEFSTVISAIMVAVICFALYYWMRRRRLAYVQA